MHCIDLGGKTPIKLSCIAMDVPCSTILSCVFKFNAVFTYFDEMLSEGRTIVAIVGAAVAQSLTVGLILSHAKTFME